MAQVVKLMHVPYLLTVDERAPVADNHAPGAHFIAVGPSIFVVPSLGANAVPLASPVWI